MPNAASTIALKEVLSLKKLPDGRINLGFSMIGYAKPQVGDQRFKSPQKLLKFHRDEIDLTRERDVCFHHSTFIRIVVNVGTLWKLKQSANRDTNLRL